MLFLCKIWTKLYASRSSGNRLFQEKTSVMKLTLNIYKIGSRTQAFCWNQMKICKHVRNDMSYHHTNLQVNNFFRTEDMKDYPQRKWNAPIFRKLHVLADCQNAGRQNQKFPTVIGPPGAPQSYPMVIWVGWYKVDFVESPLKWLQKHTGITWLKIEMIIRPVKN